MDPAVARHFNAEAPQFDRLAGNLFDDYDPEAWGLGIYSSIETHADRAIASGLLVSLSEGVRDALVDVAIAAHEFAQLLGPNGRTMPGPETKLDDSIALVRMEALTVDAFRAVGSVLDCLAGVAALLAGLPLPVQRAEGGWLTPTREYDLSSPQRSLWNEIVDVVAAEGNQPEPGWLAWALETRNAVVHRGRLLRTWLNRPTEYRPGGRRFFIRTNISPQYLVRMEPHLRRRPWLADIHAISREGDVADLWLAEPTHKTLEYLAERSRVVADQVGSVLLRAWETERLPSFRWPVAAWHLAATTSSRIAQAGQFSGFERDYPTPPPAEIRMNAASAKRPALAERLRQLGLD